MVRQQQPGQHSRLQVLGERGVAVNVRVVLIKFKPFAEVLVRAGQQRQRLLHLLAFQALGSLFHLCVDQLH